MSERLKGHSSAGLKRLLRHQQDDLFLLSETDPRAEQLEREIVATRKLIRRTQQDENAEEIANSKE